ncbi:MAG TPA: VCBS repeat-containing protein [Polyangiaceae bacterium]
MATGAGWNNQPTPVESWWTVKAAADFNGDRRADILWQDSQGRVSIWFMSGGTRIGENSPGSVATNTQLAAIGDFDGNSKADILWRSADGILWSWFSGVKGADSIRYRNEFGPGNWDWAVQGAGDFDHDGRDDILWRHKDGHVAIWLVQGARFNGELYPPMRDKSWQVKTLIHASGL